MTEAMAAGPISERNQDATIYVGGLDEKVTEAIVWELFVQAGPVVNVHMPKDRVTQNHQGYGFVEFLGTSSLNLSRCVLMPRINRWLKKKIIALTRMFKKFRSSLKTSVKKVQLKKFS